MLFDPKWKDAEAKTTNPVRDLLLRAADLIEQRGLAKHMLEDNYGQLCINGALLKADQRDADFANWSDRVHLASRAVSNYLTDRYRPGIGYSDPAMWNNEPARTKEEVVEALRATAATV